MRAGEPSRTAFGAALLRAQHQDLDGASVFADPLAWTILGGHDDAGLDLPAEGPASPARLRLFIAARHRFAEDALADAVRRGTRQVVVLGAGLDTFAYRNPHPGTRVFEVDFPATGAWKRERLAATGIAVPDSVAYVGVDLETESFLDGLAAAGFDADAPAFFLWLGVVPYLTRDAVESTLAAVASVTGGEIVFDHTSPVAQLSAQALGDRTELAARVADLGEPLATELDSADLHAVLARLGFGEVEDLGRPEIRARYLGRPGGGAGGGGAHLVRARMLS